MSRAHVASPRIAQHDTAALAQLGTCGGGRGRPEAVFDVEHVVQPYPALFTSAVKGSEFHHAPTRRSP
jgi:hypothetical protein